MRSARRPLDLVSLTLLLFAVVAPEGAAAGKLELAVGVFSLTAESAGRTGTASGLGFYHLAYRATLLERFEIDAAYSLSATGIYRGDLAYGPDLGFNWFPVSATGPQPLSSGGSSGFFAERWRPYAGVFFAQRNFQSVQSGYAGFGGKIGIERTLNDRISLKGDVRATRLSGSRTSSASVYEGSFGLVVHFE